MALQIGDSIPDLLGKDQNGQAFKLSEHTEKKWIIYFYPKDNTPGCTAEACSLRDEMSTLAAAGFSVVGVSADSAASHKRFIEKQQLNFPLIADSEKSLIQAIGAWGEKKMAGRKYMGILRTTIITDENGCVEHIITKVNTKEAAKQILELFK